MLKDVKNYEFKRRVEYPLRVLSKLSFNLLSVCPLSVLASLYQPLSLQTPCSLGNESQRLLVEGHDSISETIERSRMLLYVIS